MSGHSIDKQRQIRVIFGVIFEQGQSAAIAPLLPE
jgi:hypothetical protein